MRNFRNDFVCSPEQAKIVFDVLNSNGININFTTCSWFMLGSCQKINKEKEFFEAVKNIEFLWREEKNHIKEFIHDSIDKKEIPILKSITENPILPLGISEKIFDLGIKTLNNSLALHSKHDGILRKIYQTNKNDDMIVSSLCKNINTPYDILLEIFIEGNKVNIKNILKNKKISLFI